MVGTAGSTATGRRSPERVTRRPSTCDDSRPGRVGPCDRVVCARPVRPGRRPPRRESLPRQRLRLAAAAWYHWPRDGPAVMGGSVAMAAPGGWSRFPPRRGVVGTCGSHPAAIRRGGTTPLPGRRDTGREPTPAALRTAPPAWRVWKRDRCRAASGTAAPVPQHITAAPRHRPRPASRGHPGVSA